MRKSFSKTSGFTLIELIVTLAVLAILSTVGIASFISYNRLQSLNTAALDVVTMLNKAKSRAQSQVNVCGNHSLDGYKVIIVPPPNNTYSLYAVCNGGSFSVSIESKTLPVNINFNGATTTFLFRVLVGRVDTPGTISINGYSQTKNITVDISGNISLN